MEDDARVLELQQKGYFRIDSIAPMEFKDVLLWLEKNTIHVGQSYRVAGDDQSSDRDFEVTFSIPESGGKARAFRRAFQKADLLARQGFSLGLGVLKPEPEVPYCSGCGYHHSPVCEVF